MQSHFHGFWEKGQVPRRRSAWWPLSRLRAVRSPCPLVPSLLSPPLLCSSNPALSLSSLGPLPLSANPSTLPSPRYADPGEPAPGHTAHAGECAPALLLCLLHLWHHWRAALGWPASKSLLPGGELHHVSAAPHTLPWDPWPGLLGGIVRAECLQTRRISPLSTWSPSLLLVEQRD